MRVFGLMASRDVLPRDWVIEHLKAGKPVGWVAEASGWTRQQVYAAGNEAGLGNSDQQARPVSPAAACEHRRLLNVAAKGSKRLQGAGNAAEKALARVAELIEAEQAQRKEEAAELAERARLRDKAAQLQRELKETQALLKKHRSTRGTASVAAGGGLDPKAVRAWAAANNVTCPAVGRVPQRVVDAWRAAQQSS